MISDLQVNDLADEAIEKGQNAEAVLAPHNLRRLGVNLLDHDIPWAMMKLNEELKRRAAAAPANADSAAA